MDKLTTDAYHSLAGNLAVHIPIAAKTYPGDFIVSVPDQMRSTAIRGARRVRERAGLAPGAGLSGKLDRSPRSPVLMSGDGGEN